MATTDYDYSSTRAEIIARSLRLVGALALGDLPSADQTGQCVQALNEMVKSWQSRGIQLWGVVTDSIALVDGTASYAVETDPPVIEVDAAYIREGSDDEPLERITFRDYQDIPDKASEGKPELYALSLETTPTLYLYPVPSTTSLWTLYYRGVGKLKDWDTSSGTSVMPSRWSNALVYGLAADLADEYKLSISERQHLVGRAEFFFSEARRFNKDDSDAEFIHSCYPR